MATDETQRTLLSCLLDDDDQRLRGLLSEGGAGPSTELGVELETLRSSHRFLDAVGPKKGRLLALQLKECPKEISLLQAAVRLGATRCMRVFSAVANQAGNASGDSSFPVTPLEEAAYQHDESAFTLLVDAGADPLHPRVLTMLFAGLYPPWHEYGVKAGSSEEAAILRLTTRILHAASNSAAGTGGHASSLGYRWGAPSRATPSWALAAASMPSALTLILDAADAAHPYGAQHLLMKQFSGRLRAVHVAALSCCVEGVDICIRRSIGLGTGGEWTSTAGTP